MNDDLTNSAEITKLGVHDEFQDLMNCICNDCFCRIIKLIDYENENMKSNEYFKSFFFDDADYERSCTSKNRYDSEWQAKFAADEQMRKCNVKLSWYKCKYCNGWHLTSR